MRSAPTARLTPASLASTDTAVEQEADFGTRAAVAAVIAHTILCAGLGYYLGYISGIEEGQCTAVCDEATAGLGTGHVMEQGCTCTVKDDNGETRLWVESLESLRRSAK